VQAAREQLLADPCLAEEKDGSACRREHPGPSDGFAQRLALPDHRLEPRPRSLRLDRARRLRAAHGSGRKHDERSDPFPALDHRLDPGRREPLGKAIPGGGRLEVQRRHAEWMTRRERLPRQGQGRGSLAVRLDGEAPAIEQDDTIGMSDGEERHAALQDAEALRELELLQPRLDLGGSGDDEGETLAGVGVARPGDVQRADDARVARVANDRGGTGPALDPLAEVLGPVYLDGLADGERRADGVRAGREFVPRRAGDERDLVGPISRLRVAFHADDDSFGVGEKHDPPGVGEEVARRRHDGGARLEQRAVTIAASLQTTIVEADCATSERGIDVLVTASEP
jgi:hypothetical protein